ncbi:DMT family transporter [Saprospira grandis]|uniref:RhaT n=1 Tax=Saprospira grandis (strain Lewin) TaxID=984262 RepID=H6L233_SAPGL|nr:DMT family transporter [Saprospira grandis]AFC23570.1 RhaT [Saprospira grandis str. Lewin]
MKIEIKANLGLQLAVMLFGGAGLFARFSGLSASQLVLGRTFFAACCLFFFLPNVYALIKKNYQLSLRLGALLALHWWSFFMAIQQGSLALGVISFAAFPLFTVLLRPLLGQGPWLRSDLGRSLWLLLGVMLLIFPSLNAGDLLYVQAWGWGLCSAFSFALLSWTNKRALANLGANALAFLQNFGAFICLAFWQIWQLESWPSRYLPYFYLLLLGLVFTAGAHFLYIWALGHLRTEKVSLMASLEPLYAIFWALLLLGDWPSWEELLAAVVILGAVFWPRNSLEE